MVSQDEEVLVELLQLLVRLGCVSDWRDERFVELEYALEIVHGVQRVVQLEVRALGVSTEGFQVGTQVGKLSLSADDPQSLCELRHADEV